MGMIGGFCSLDADPTADILIRPPDLQQRTCRRSCR
jgi:hypothetical protein